MYVCVYNYSIEFPIVPDFVPDIHAKRKQNLRSFRVRVERKLISLEFRPSFVFLNPMILIVDPPSPLAYIV